MQRDKDFGGFLGATFDLIGRNWLAILIYAVVIGGISATGVLFGLIDLNENIGGFNVGFVSQGGQTATVLVFMLLALVVSVIGAYFLLAQYLRSDNRLRTTDTRIWAYVGMSVLAGLGTMLGLVLLIVPGIILLVRWSASSGFLIGQGTTVIDSLGQSWEATRGYSWPIFFAGLVFAILIGVVFGAISAATIAFGNLTVTAVISSFGDAASNALYYAFGIGVYTILNDVSEETAEVFS